jgi:hypothetical protein
LYFAYRDEELSIVFVRFRAPLHPDAII